VDRFLAQKGAGVHFDHPISPRLLHINNFPQFFKASVGTDPRFRAWHASTL
jgi:hypothetical protein